MVNAEIYKHRPPVPNPQGNPVFYVDILASRIHKNIDVFDSTNNLIIFGEPGSGKSYFALLLAYLLNDRYGFEFDVNKHVVFSVADAVALSFKKHQVIILDEGAFALDKTQHMTVENRTMAGILRMNRMNKNVFIFVAQEYQSLDFRVRYFVKDVIRMYFNYSDPSRRYFDVLQFANYERTKLKVQTIYLKNHKIEFKKMVAPNINDYRPDWVEAYQARKKELYKDVVLDNFIKLVKKMYNVKDDEIARDLAVKFLQSRGIHVTASDFTTIEEKQKTTARKYAEEEKYILNHIDEFLEGGAISYKLIMKKFPHIPRSTARDMAKRLTRVLPPS